MNVSCWEDGPRDDRDVGSTCMLDEGHDGPHEFTPDDQITVTFAASPPERQEPT